MRAIRSIRIAALFVFVLACASAPLVRAAYSFKVHNNTRHTIVTEYLFPEQRKETKRLDRRIRQVKRTFTKRDNPEGAAALRSLRAVRDQVAGARESLLPTRFYVVLYGERARNLVELRKSVADLDEQCEKMIAALRQLPGANAEREEPEALRALYPAAIAGDLSPAEIRRLHRGINDAIRAGIARQGATLRDYRTPDGASGSMQDELRVYGRGGEPCRRCGTEITKTRAGGRGTWYCPNCQRSPI